MRLALLSLLLVLAAACNGGKTLGESCRLDDSTKADPCGHGTICYITEACQEGSTGVGSCSGTCEYPCVAGGCDGGVTCSCNSYSPCACLRDGGH